MNSSSAAVFRNGRPMARERFVAAGSRPTGLSRAKTFGTWPCNIILPGAMSAPRLETIAPSKISSAKLFDGLVDTVKTYAASSRLMADSGT